MYKGNAKLNTWQWCFVGLVFVWCLVGASLIRVECCPDEWARRLLSDFMFRNGKLPVGEEAEIVMENYGFSYAIYPYLASMINAGFMRIISVFTGSERALLAASRMCSVVSVALCAMYLQKIGNLFFRQRCVSTLFAALVCFLPQVMFLGMYQNNDALALCGICAVIYSVIVGNRNRWRWPDCIRLGIWAGITLLSYYNAYGWLLVCGIATVASFLRRNDSGSDPVLGKEPSRALGRDSGMDPALGKEPGIDWKNIALKWALIFGIIAATAGWFFIRNAMLHNGDFLGFATETADRQRLIDQGVWFKNYRRPSEIPGYTLWQMLMEDRCCYLVAVLKSYIGAFGNLDLFMDGWVYVFYYAVLIAAIGCFGVLLFREKKTAEEKWFLGGCVVATVITFGLTLINSYYTDYQPQGRYLIATQILVAFVIAAMLNRRKRQTAAPVYTGIAIWIGMFGYVFFMTMKKMFI